GKDAAKAEVNPHDAVVLLSADDKEIRKLAQEFERRRKVAGPIEKGKLALRICNALRSHGRVKKEIFYPAAEAVLAGHDKEMLGKARLEQDELLHLLGKVESRLARSPDFHSAGVLVVPRGPGPKQRERRRSLPPPAPFRSRSARHRRAHGGPQGADHDGADRPATDAAGTQGDGWPPLAVRNRSTPVPLSGDLRPDGAPRGEAAIPDSTVNTTDEKPASVLAHGARVLPAVTVDTYNAELREEEGFVGDQASGRAFPAI